MQDLKKYPTEHIGYFYAFVDHNSHIQVPNAASEINPGIPKNYHHIILAGSEPLAESLYPPGLPMGISHYVNQAIILSGCPSSGRHPNYTISSLHFTQNLFINIPIFPGHFQPVLTHHFHTLNHGRHHSFTKSFQMQVLPNLESIPVLPLPCFLASSTTACASSSDTVADNSCFLASNTFFLSRHIFPVHWVLKPADRHTGCYISECLILCVISKTTGMISRH